MNQLESLEITTDFIQNNFDHYNEQSYSEFSGVSIGNENDTNYCKGIDYSQLQLPTNHALSHLKITYQVKQRMKLQFEPNYRHPAGVNGNMINFSSGCRMPTQVLYNSLIPGYDHSEQQSLSNYNHYQLSDTQTFKGTERSINQGSNLPIVHKITIFVNEI